MPQFLPAPVNTAMHTGQHYSRRTLLPGKHVYKGGICLGFTLAWLKHVQTGRKWMSTPTQMEAMLLQQLYCIGISTRDQARNNWDTEQEEAAFIEKTRSQSPRLWVQDPRLLHCCQLQGFQPRYLGEWNAYRILAHLNGLRASDISTFVLCSAGHALGLAIREEAVALFDANTGVTLFSAKEAIDSVQLMHHLNRYLRVAPFPGFGVLHLKF
ncbi:hypothetical protein D3C77_192270 [compost metagenome]|jgi:hypothetical protein